MGEITKIQWCHHTWSPWRGCTKVSEGCKNCYADKTAKRNPSTLGVWGPNGTRIVNANWGQLAKWNRLAEKTGVRERVFPSLCDPFEDWIGFMHDCKGEIYRHINGEPASMQDIRANLFDSIEMYDSLDFLLLTKRQRISCQCGQSSIDRPASQAIKKLHSNVWLGTSVEDQQNADKRIPKLLECRHLSPVLWLSVEPLIGPVDLSRIEATAEILNWRCGGLAANALKSDDQRYYEFDSHIDWVIVGGESGPNARPCDIRWIRSIVDQCREAGVPCFVKQLGENPVDGERRVKLKDSKGGDPEEWPEDLRVREFPLGVADRV